MCLVTVITPTYNRADKLPTAIESVLDQTFENFEYIIVDDASTDHTQSVVDSYNDDRIRYLRHEENKRQAAARNTGIKAANGDFVAFLDSDDAWNKKKLEIQANWIQQRSPHWVGVYCDGHTERTSRLKEVVTSWFPYEIRRGGQEELIESILTMQGNISAGTSLMVRTESAKEIGGFDESLPRHEDLDFTIRLLQQGKLGYIDEELFIVHESVDPSAKLLEESKEQYLSKFDDEIERLETEGVPVTKYHDFHLGRAFIADGCFREGINYLRGAKASNPRQYLRLCLATLEGIKKNII